MKWGFSSEEEKGEGGPLITVCLQRGQRETWLQLCPAWGCPCNAGLVGTRILVLFLDKCAQLDSEPGAQGLAGSPSPVLLVLESQGQCLRKAGSCGEHMNCPLPAPWVLLSSDSSAWMDGQGCGWMDGSEHSATTLSIPKIKRDTVQSLQSRSEIPCSALAS